MQGFLPLVQRCTANNDKGIKNEFLLNHYMAAVGSLRYRKSRRPLSMTEEAKSFCFINAVTRRNEYAGIVMTKEEYYDAYIRRHIKYDKTINAVRTNYLRKSNKLLMQQPYGLALKRFEIFEETITKAIEGVSVSILKMSRYLNKLLFLVKWYL